MLLPRPKTYPLNGIVHGMRFPDDADIIEYTYAVVPKIRSDRYGAPVPMFGIKVVHSAYPTAGILTSDGPYDGTTDDR